MYMKPVPSFMDIPIHDIYHIDRGYDNLDEKLNELGAKVWREEVE